MSPPDGGPRILWEIAGEKFPAGYQEYGYWYLKHLTLAVRTVESQAPEANTSLVIQKYCNELREHNVSWFAPFPVYLGGRYSGLIENCLQGLIERGVLSRRGSKLGSVNRTVYEVSDTYKDSLEPPSVWEDLFGQFRAQFDLKNLLEDHDQKRILRWVKDEDAYQWVTSESKKRNPSRIDRSATENNRTGSPEVPAEIKKFDPKTRDAATQLYTIIDEYKNIGPRRERIIDTEQKERARRKFSIQHINEHFEEYGNQILGDLVFIVGYFDVAEERWQSADPDTVYLREHIASPDSIGVIFSKGLKDLNIDIYTISVGVLGELTARDGEVIIDPISILKSDQLPDSLVSRQHEERKQKQVDLVEERNELFEDLKQLHEEQSGTQSPEEIKEELERVLEDSDLDNDERDVLNDLKELIGIAAASEGINWVITKIVQNYPEYTQDILDAIGL